MKHQITSVQNSLQTDICKDSKKNDNKAQMKRYFEFLKHNVATNSMCSDALGIPQKNLTRYKRKFEKNNQLWEVYRTKCKHTGHKASYLTTDPDKAPEAPQQLSLFDEILGGKK